MARRRWPVARGSLRCVAVCGFSVVSLYGIDSCGNSNHCSASSGKRWGECDLDVPEGDEAW